ncbi:MAG: hypothetical protein IJQ53_02505 [Clostridia bacterium]|nr:hypothetical protein [Clostridia bacterium]
MKKTATERGYRVEYTLEKPEYIANGQPFENRFDHGEFVCETEGVGRERAVVRYEKRPGGIYIYANNPEMLAPEDVNVPILRTKGIHGDAVFTFEHSNYTGEPLHIGYQLYNEGETEVTVTVYNIGLQLEGEWLGQRSWSDYFNRRFELPQDYFREDGSVDPIYVGCDYIDYTPEKYDPQTFKIPSGKYVYVLGGTSADAFANANAGGTADREFLPGKCGNGVVKFRVDGGEVTGTFYAYNDASKLDIRAPEQGFVTERYNARAGKVLDYSRQYKGVDPTAGLIESRITFVVDDDTPRGNLPVVYAKHADAGYARKTKPYNAYDCRPVIIESESWTTSLDPNSCKEAIGSDMMVFNCVSTDGQPLCIDTFHADSSGSAANIGNWMVQYTDNFTLVNAGSKERTFDFYKRGNKGVLFTMARGEDGGILAAKALTGPYSFGSEAEIFAGVDRSLLVEKNGRLWFRLADGRPYCDAIDERSEVIKIAVPPMSVKRISIDSVILGNSCGGIKHWVVLG